MQSSTLKTEETHLGKWFEETVAALRSHQLMLETNTASKKIKNTYNILINGTEHDINYHSKLLAQMHFVKSILIDYLKTLGTDLPSKLAVNYNDSEVLVWAEIEDNNNKMEEALLIAEAKINAKYHNYGFDMETTIVETSDHLSVPNHYQRIK